MEHERDPDDAAPPARGTTPSALEPSRACVAEAPVAGGGGAQALSLSPARHAGALRGLPVAGAGDRARGRGGDADPRGADRESPSRGGAAAPPRAAPWRTD